MNNILKTKKMKKIEKKASFFKRMFMDENDINEKSIVGFGSFIMMVVCLGVDIWTGFHGQEMPINEFIFDGFMVICLGAFGIASVDKYITTKNGSKEKEEDNE
jgi:hypothetical protein